MQLKILNAKEMKQIYAALEKQFGFSGKLDYGFLFSERKDRLYIANKEVFEIDLRKINLSSVGMYFGEFKDGEIRLSIEGSQIIGPKATKGVVEIPDYKEWMAGNELEHKGDEKGFVIIKCGDDYLGCGRAGNGKISNFVGKVRRVRLILN